jgi:hypothetical protein
MFMQQTKTEAILAELINRPRRVAASKLFDESLETDLARARFEKYTGEETIQTELQGPAAVAKTGDVYFQMKKHPAVVDCFSTPLLLSVGYTLDAVRDFLPDFNGLPEIEQHRFLDVMLRGALQLPVEKALARIAFCNQRIARQPQIVGRFASERNQHGLSLEQSRLELIAPTPFSSTSISLHSYPVEYNATLNRAQTRIRHPLELTLNNTRLYFPQDKMGAGLVIFNDALNALIINPGEILKMQVGFNQYEEP